MKKINKIAAATMATGMGIAGVAGGVSPVFAADPVVGVSGEQTDKADAVAKATVSGAKDATSVVLYQLVDGYYKDGALIKYVLTDPTNGSIADLEAPTAAEIAAIANYIQENGDDAFDGQKIDMTKVGDNWEKDVEAGMYLVLATGADGTVYNPALVSINIEDATKGDPGAGSVAMTDFFKEGETSVYLKSSISSMDKTIVGAVGTADDATQHGNNRGDTVAVGDDVEFVINGMVIPSFSGDYTAPKYVISDKLEATAFQAPSDIVVKVNGAVLAAKDGDNVNYTLVEADNGFKISFSETYLRAHASDATRPTVEVTYKSKVLETAGVNFAENVNHAELSYSNDPTDEDGVETIKKNTYHYTFAIDALVDAEGGDVDDSHELNKVTEQSTFDEHNVANHPLAGATFALYNDAAMEDDNVIATAISDAKGHISFTGLDEGVYYMKETQAPSGYNLNDNDYRITISADIDATDGLMKSYTIKTDTRAATAQTWTEANSATYTNTASSVDADTGDVTFTLNRNVLPLQIIDTKLQGLPSTGGNGIKVAVTAAAVLACAAGGITVVAKKKEKDAE